MKNRLALPRMAVAAAVAFACASLGDDCDGDIVQDPTFRDWCGASLCSWKTDFGQIARVPTWIQEDFGVSFLDNGTTGTEISQVTEENQATCILFTSVGNIDPTAEMTVSVDFNNDGSIDYIGALGSAKWETVQTEITAPPRYQGITFYVKKSGTGTAILAEMAIQSRTGCTAPAPKIGNLRFGETCSSTSECQSGFVCPEWVDGGTQFCGQCTDQIPCEGGVTCQTRSVFFPLQCGPGQGLGQSGAPCLANSDCASAECDGAMPVEFVLGDAATPCDLDTVGPDSGSNCSWATALGGTCR
jgi:hypothetical protein